MSLAQGTEPKIGPVHPPGVIEGAGKVEPGF